MQVHLTLCKDFQIFLEVHGKNTEGTSILAPTLNRKTFKINKYYRLIYNSVCDTDISNNTKWYLDHKPLLGLDH